MKTNKLVLSITALISLSGCMAAKQLVGPEKTLTEDSSKLIPNNRHPS